MPGRKRVELVVTFECDEADNPRDATGMVEAAVEDSILNAWAVSCDIMNEEEL